MVALKNAFIWASNWVELTAFLHSRVKSPIIKKMFFCYVSGTRNRTLSSPSFSDCGDSCGNQGHIMKKVVSRSTSKLLGYIEKSEKAL